MNHDNSFLFQVRKNSEQLQTVMKSTEVQTRPQYAFTRGLPVVARGESDTG